MNPTGPATAAAVAANLAAVRERMAAACAGAGRPADAVRLVAVSKRIDLDLVAAACAAGQWDLGENRIQDALPRQDDLDAALLRARAVDPAPRALALHRPPAVQQGGPGRGPLRPAARRRLPEAGRAPVRAGGAGGLRQAVLLEVNISGEAQKDGAGPRRGAAGAGRGGRAAGPASCRA